MTKNFTQEYVPINGISQYFLHIPHSTSKEVIIMLHGGPGSPNSYIAYYQQPYLDFCHVVYYDQRGAGKTRLKNKTKPEELSYNVLVEDLRQTIQYVKEKYETDRIFLLGHSCGSLLGTQYILKYPHDLKGYIGYGQIVAMLAQEKKWCEYAKTAILKSGNKRDIKKINAVDTALPNITREEYPKLVPRISSLEYKYGYKAHEWIKFYRKSPIMTLREGFQMLSAEKFNRNLLAELFDFDIRSIKEYQVPVYYVLGRYDEWTTSTIAADYFETIRAPKKELFWIENAGHMTDIDNPEAFWSAVREIVAKK